MISADRSLQVELVKALDLPIDGCLSAEIEFKPNELIAVAVRYAVTPEVLERIANALKPDA